MGQPWGEWDPSTRSDLDRGKLTDEITCQAWVTTPRTVHVPSNTSHSPHTVPGLGPGTGCYSTKHHNESYTQPHHTLSTAPLLPVLPSYPLSPRVGYGAIQLSVDHPPAPAMMECIGGQDMRKIHRNINSRL